MRATAILVDGMVMMRKAFKWCDDGLFAEFSDSILLFYEKDVCEVSSYRGIVL